MAARQLAQAPALGAHRIGIVEALDALGGRHDLGREPLERRAARRAAPW
jgi:hypothetical protein